MSEIIDKTIKKYAKKNNILSYMSNDVWKDLEKYIDWQDYESEKEFNENIDTVEDYICHFIEQYNYELALENEDTSYMLKLIYGCDFDIEINKNGKLDLIDLQEAYLGGNYKDFEEISDVLDRLSPIYLYDYYGINNF